MPERRGLAAVVMRFLRRFAPKHAEGAERESREWYLVCRKCGNEQTYADIGGLRYGAYSNGKITGASCLACGRFRLHKLERRRGPA